MLSPARAAVRATALALVAGLTLVGCGGSGDDSSAGDSSSSPSTSGSGSASGSGSSSGSGSGSPSRPAPSQTTDVEVPPGVALTDPGSQLGFGDTARVAFEVQRPATGGKKASQKTTTGTVLALTVRSARQGSLADLAGFNLTDPYEKRANYFYVRVTVKNVGARRFGGADVPLWGISGENTLLPPVRFTSAFAKCPTSEIPPGFEPGARIETCLVFLSPDKGSLEGVSYRPTEDFTPIEWHGKVVTPKADRKPRGRSGRSGGSGGSGGSGRSGRSGRGG